jgi:hypothetical protein
MSSDVSLDGDSVTITGTTTINNDLSVGGNATFNNISVNGNLTGNPTFNDVTVSGNSTFNDITINGRINGASVKGKLNVSTEFEGPGGDRAIECASAGEVCIVASSDSNYGIWGSCFENSDKAGILGEAFGASGCGGEFRSANGSQIYLKPSFSPSAGAPTSGNHNMGELYVDSTGVLYFCVGNGNPGTWKKVQLVDP